MFVFVLFLLQALMPGVLVFLSTQVIAERYLQAVISVDLDVAERLGGVVTRQQAMEDIKIFGSAEVRNVQIDTWVSEGSSEELESAGISFEYRTSPSGEWVSGSTCLITSYSWPGRRYAIGRYP